MQLTSDETAMAILVFIRELSFRLTKVLDQQLEVILSAIYALMTNTKNASLKKEAVYTLRTLSKYSSDIKMLYFITLMPEQMFTKFKLANTYCISFILQKENLNILVFEESLLISLIKIAAELFADAHQTINDLGEGIVVDLFKRFMERKKADVFLKMLRAHVSPKRADQILKFLRLNFDNIEEIVEISRKLQTFESDNMNRPVSSNNLFSRNGVTSLDSGGGMIQRFQQQDDIGDNIPKNLPKTSMKMNTSREERPIAGRNHDLQDRLINEIHQLLSS